MSSVGKNACFLVIRMFEDDLAILSYYTLYTVSRPVALFSHSLFQSSLIFIITTLILLSCVHAAIQFNHELHEWTRIIGSLPLAFNTITTKSTKIHEKCMPDLWSLPSTSISDYAYLAC